MDFNIARIFEAVEARNPDRLCLIGSDNQFTYRQLGTRARQLAQALHQRGLGNVVPRENLRPYQSGQDHLGICLHNGNEYLEAMLGAFNARIAPFNINYRYSAEELRYLLTDAKAAGLIFHSCFAPILQQIRGDLPWLKVLLQVPDGSHHPLLDGAEWYDSACSTESGHLPIELDETRSPEDLCILYTGGTTGRPKGVLWRQCDLWVAALGGRSPKSTEEIQQYEAISLGSASGGTRLLSSAPFMHGAAQWLAFTAFGHGNTVILPRLVDRFDAEDILDTIESERANVLLIVGDSFAKPIISSLTENSRDLSSLQAIVSGGASLSERVKSRLLDLLPETVLLDGLGSSETGQLGSQLLTPGQHVTSGAFSPAPGSVLLSEDLTRLLSPEEDQLGWLAQQGRVPLGYLGDAERTTTTFPVIDGVHYSVPGDRARFTTDGTILLLGRDGSTINTGGEKVFAEEVEAALADHQSVIDVVVCGRDSPRWGTEVVAIVCCAEPTSSEALAAHAAQKIARFKLPKAYVFVDAIQRSPAGKADYRWAVEIARRAQRSEG